MHPLERKALEDKSLENKSLERKSVDEVEHFAPLAPVRQTWIHKLGIFLFIVVCFEVGAFLTVFPWTSQWDNNFLGNLFPWIRDLWGNSYFRGALSGLGLLNVYISLGEVSRLRRSASKIHPVDKLKASTL